MATACDPIAAVPIAKTLNLMPSSRTKPNNDLKYYKWTFCDGVTVGRIVGDVSVATCADSNTHRYG